MNRRNFFKGIAALPLALVAPTAPAKTTVYSGLDLSSAFKEGFVPRRQVMYLHKGEPHLEEMRDWYLSMKGQAQ